MDLDTPQLTDGRLHETELWPYPHTTYPFSGRPLPDVITRQHERLYFVDPRKYVPRIGNRTAFPASVVLYPEDFSQAVWTKNLLTPSRIKNPVTGQLAAWSLSPRSKERGPIEAFFVFGLPLFDIERGAD